MIEEHPHSRATFSVSLGRRIRARREELGLTLTALAERTGTSKTQLSMVENGLRGLTIWTAATIAHALEMTLDDLTDGLV